MTRNTAPALIGSAPDSWGVWFPDDPRQTSWERFLDEVAAAGYTRIELGPYGYLPTDPVRLKEELDKRGRSSSTCTAPTRGRAPGVTSRRPRPSRRRWAPSTWS